MRKSEFNRQALLDRLVQFGITLRSLSPAQRGDAVADCAMRGFAAGSEREP
jgi:hypothetical protein